MKKNQKIAAIVAVLFLITAVLAVVHLGSRVSAPEGTLRVETGDQVIELALMELRSQPIHGTTVNGKGEERMVNAQGVPLSQALAQAGVTQFAQVIVAADDEYSAVVTAEEVEAADRVFLLLDGGERPQLLVFGDSNSKRNVSGVVRLIIQ